MLQLNHTLACFSVHLIGVNEINKMFQTIVAVVPPLVSALSCSSYFKYLVLVIPLLLPVFQFPN
jgi:hypothetical protein